MSDEKDVAEIVGDAPPGIAYERLAAAQVLGYQRCTACAHAVFTPRVLCPACGSVELTWTASAGVGSVYSVTTLQPRHQQPHAVALIDLDEGFRMMSQVVDVPAGEVAIDSRVQVVFRDAEDGPLPYFRPVS